MTGLTYDQVKGWRETARAKLEEAGFIVLDPARGLMHLKPEVVIKDAYEESFTENKHTVFIRDKFDVTRADISLFNLLDAKRASIGTVSEMAWCHLTGKFAVVVMEREGNPHMHAFVREEAGVLLDNIDDAVDYIIRTFGG
jgi:hypothetical protein